MHRGVSVFQVSGRTFANEAEARLQPPRGPEAPRPLRAAERSRTNNSQLPEFKRRLFDSSLVVFHNQVFGSVRSPSVSGDDNLRTPVEFKTQDPGLQESLAQTRGSHRNQELLIQSLYLSYICRHERK